MAIVDIYTMVELSKRFEVTDMKTTPFQLKNMEEAIKNKDEDE